MKKLMIAFIAFTLVSCSSPSIEGKWNLSGIEGETLSESEKSTLIHFENTGAFTLNREGMERKGSWTYDKEVKLILIKEEDGTNQEWTNVELKGDDLSFTDRSKKISLKRVK